MHTPTRLALSFLSPFRPLDCTLIRALPAESPNQGTHHKAPTKAPTTAPMTAPTTDDATNGATDGAMDGAMDGATDGTCASLRIASLAEICACFCSGSALVALLNW